MENTRPTIGAHIIGLQGTSMCRRRPCVCRIPYKSGQFFPIFIKRFLGIVIKFKSIF